MVTTSSIFIALAVLAVIVGAYVLLSLSRHGWRKIGGPAFFGLTLLAICAGTVFAMGLPRPLWTFFYSTGEYRLLNWSYVEGKAIFLWVTPADDGDPIVVELPWSEKTADALNTTLDQFKLSDLTGQVNLGSLARGDPGAIVTPTGPYSTEHVRVKDGN